MPTPARKPDDEAVRLAALRAYDVLDTPPESGYDDLTQIAAQIFDVPIALVSLVDAERQWFKSRRGLGATETHRDLAFCAHAILDPERPFVVENALSDPRFADSPLVQQDPNIRFYAGAPLVTPAGQPIGTLCVIAPDARQPSDSQLAALGALARQVVTQLELRRTALRYRAAKEHAERAARAEAEFLATMSHEIRTPLNAILGFTEVLQQTSLDTEQREYTELISRSGDLLLNLIGDILDISKIEAGKLEVAREPVNVGALGQGVAKLFSHAAADRGLRLDVELPGDLPLATADGARVTQVLVNLVGNALKFTEAGGVTLAVRGDGPALRVEVRDTGVGLAPGQVSTLFQKFVQADAGVARRHGGTGLGLAISRELIELMGGRIGCESAPGAGSTFWFELPRAAEQTTTGAAVTAGVGDGHTQVSGHVLVVEDNLVNQKLVHHLLTRMGCEVSLASGGAEGVAAACEGSYDLVLMDCQMPQVDGYTATRRIRERLGDAGPPIVALTADCTVRVKGACFEAGMDDFLTKPLRRGELAAALAKWLPAAPANAAGG